jgi:hypothetical protein
MRFRTGIALCGEPCDLIEHRCLRRIRLREKCRQTGTERNLFLLHISNDFRHKERRMVQVPGLVKLRSALTREGVGGADDVMDD